MEGDAAFLFTEITAEPTAVAADVSAQILRFFDAFKLKQQALINHAAGGCPCDACTNIHQLQLKVVAHTGQAVFKKIKNFNELAGEDVILVHRLLKNSVTASEYILLTDAFYRLTGNLFGIEPETLTETYDWLGDVTVKVFYPKTLTLSLPVAKPVSKPLGMLEAMRMWLMALWHRLLWRRNFSHVPYESA